MSSPGPWTCSPRRWAKRTGRGPDDPAVHTLAGAIFGVIMATTLPTLESWGCFGRDGWFGRIPGLMWWVAPARDLGG